jgi:hypothetical protein
MVQSLYTAVCYLLYCVILLSEKPRHTHRVWWTLWYVHGSYWSVDSEVVKEHTHAHWHSQPTCTVVVLVMTQCSLVCGYKHFRAACYLHLHFHSADEGSTTTWHAADHLPEPRTPQSDTLTTTLLTYAPLTLTLTCNYSCLVGQDTARMGKGLLTFWRHRLLSLSSVIWSTKTPAVH